MSRSSDAAGPSSAAAASPSDALLEGYKDLDDFINRATSEEFTEWYDLIKHETTGILLKKTTEPLKTGWIPTDEQIQKASEKYMSFATKGIISGGKAMKEGAVVSQDGANCRGISALGWEKKGNEYDQLSVSNCIEQSFNVVIERGSESPFLEREKERVMFLKKNPNELQLRCRNTVFIVLVVTPHNFEILEDKYKKTIRSALSVINRSEDIYKRKASPRRNAHGESKRSVGPRDWPEIFLCDIEPEVLRQWTSIGGFFTMAAPKEELPENMIRVENERFMTVMGEQVICPDYQSHLSRIIREVPEGSIIMTHITRFNTSNQVFTRGEETFIRSGVCQHESGGACGSKETDENTASVENIASVESIRQKSLTDEELDKLLDSVPITGMFRIPSGGGRTRKRRRRRTNKRTRTRTRKRTKRKTKRRTKRRTNNKTKMKRTRKKKY